jgi:hypothetical protein
MNDSTGTTGSQEAAGVDTITATRADGAEEAPLSQRAEELYAQLRTFALRLDAEHGSDAVVAFVDVFEVYADGGSAEDFIRDARALRHGKVVEVRARLDRANR